MTARRTELPALEDWPWLTPEIGKRERFSCDLYFREGWELLTALDGGTAQAVARLALLTFKPDAVPGRRIRPTLDFLTHNGFRVVGVAPIAYTRHSVRELYRFTWDIYTIDRLGVTETLLTAGPTLLLLLADAGDHSLPPAVRLTELKGSADPALRRPEQLRAVLEPPNPVVNFVHVADEPADVLREVLVFLPAEEARPLLADALAAGADTDLREAVVEHAAILEQGVDPHDFDPAAVGGDSWTGAARERITAASGAGPRLTWDELVTLTGPASSPADTWDVVTAGAAALEITRAGVKDLLPRAEARQWLAADAARRGGAEVVARPAIDLPTAAAGYRGAAELADTDAVLDLSVTLDERELLDVDLPALIAGELAREACGGVPATSRYLLDDPYGDAVLRDAVGRHLRLDASGAGWRVTAGAGVNALLQALAHVRPERPLTVLGDAYPDLPAWRMRRGGTVAGAATDVDVASQAAVVAATRSSVVLVDRPALADDGYGDRDRLAALLDEVARDVLVVVDESYGNYGEPADSAAALVARHPGLVVLRGVSKAYWLGALRVGYAVASPDATGLLRAALAPLQCSTLALRLAATVLAHGDLASRLRERIGVHKAGTVEALRAAGLTRVRAARGALPFALVDEDVGAAQQWLADRGILARVHRRWSGAAGGPVDLLRISVPLSAERLGRLEDLLAEARAA